MRANSWAHDTPAMPPPTTATTDRDVTFLVFLPVSFFLRFPAFTLRGSDVLLSILEIDITIKYLKATLMLSKAVEENKELVDMTHATQWILGVELCVRCHEIILQNFLIESLIS